MAAPLCVTVLAAGKGTRMKNTLPKVLHPLAGRTLLGHVLATVAELTPERTVVVLAPGMDEVAAAAVGSPLTPALVLQEPQLGTGHALLVAREQLPDLGTVLVVYGDTPLLTGATLRRLVDAREAADAAVAVLGLRPREPAGYGRLRLMEGKLVEIVEDLHADAALRAQSMCNAGVMAFDAARLPGLLDALPLRTERNELYLTDTVAAAIERGWTCVTAEAEAEEGLGVNSQLQLAEVAAILQQRLRLRLLEGGVIMPAPETVQLSADTVVGAGTIIEPYVVLGPGVRIEPKAVIRSFCHLERTMVATGAEIGPYARLRPGSDIGEGAKIGNFVETKNTRLEPRAKVNHLTYLGDATVGTNANIGAGTITCNYDGFNKHATHIGAGAFIGSNTSLVAPVTIGNEAIVAAGSVITGDVPNDGFAVARSRQVTRPDRAGRLRDHLRQSGRG